MLSKFQLLQSRSSCLTENVIGLVNRSTIAAKTEYKSHTEIPGPNNTLRKMVKDSKENFGKLHLVHKSAFEEFGSIVQQKIPFVNIHYFVLNNPDTIADFLRQESKNPIRPVTPIWEASKRILGAADGILTANENWYRMRTVVNQVMLKPNTVQSYELDLNSTADDFLIKLEGLRDADKVADNLADNMFRWALESVGTILYEKRLGCLDEVIDPDNARFIAAVRTLFKSTAELFVFPPTVAKWFRRSLYKSHLDAWNTVYSVAERYSKIKLKEVENIERKEGDEVGLIEYFVKSQNMSMKEVYANITELMAGGVDTTSNAAQFLLYELSSNPAVQNKLYTEIRDNVGENEMVTSQSLKNMHYLKACIKETMRMYPIVIAVSRELQEDTALEGYLIPKGKWIVYVPYVLGRQKSLFSEPDVFKPERFLRSEVDRDKIHPFANLPFGFGTRMCIGRRVAELEIQILVTKILRRFKLEPVDEKPIEIYCDITMSPAKPLRLRYLDRE